MAIKPTTKSKARPPRLLKVTVPSFEMAECEDAPLLAGEYFLALRDANEDRLDWIVRFHPICGYMAMRAKHVRQSDGTWELTLQAFGGPNRVLWKLTGITELIPEKSLILSQEYSEPDDWPMEMVVTPVAN